MDTVCEPFAISSQLFQLVCPTSWERAVSRFIALSAKKFTRRRPSDLISMERFSVPHCPTFSFRSLGARSYYLLFSLSMNLRYVDSKSQESVAVSFSCPARKMYSKRRSVSVACVPECSPASLKTENHLGSRTDKRTWTKTIIIVGVVRIAATSKVSRLTILRNRID